MTALVAIGERLLCDAHPALKYNERISSVWMEEVAGSVR
jgi:hypothetical protein